MGVALEKLGSPQAYKAFSTSMYWFARSHSYNAEIKDCLQYASSAWALSEGNSVESVVRTRTIPGVLLATVDPMVDSDVSFVMHESGYWDTRTLEIIRSALSMKPSGAIGDTPKGVFVDVGAHVGFFSLYAAAMGHTVHAFEPAKKHIKAIKRSLELNGPGVRTRFHLHENIVADRDGSMSINTFDIGPSGSAFAEVVRDGRAKGAGDNLVSVARISATVKGPIDMMKIDVEGCELTVLKSALKPISKGKVHQMVYENCPYLWGRCSTNANDAERVLGQLLHQGYFLYIYDGDAQSSEFYGGKKKGHALPQVQMPGDDYKLFVLPNNIKKLMKIFRRQADESFCNHIWVTQFDLQKEQKQTHTEL